MIREANYFDIPKIVRLAEEFAEESKVREVVGFDKEAIKTLATNLINDDNGIVLVGQDSLLAGIVSPHPFNPEVKVFIEFMWRAKDKEGLALLKEAEKLAKEKGAKLSTMMGLSSMPDITKLYNRLGYVQTETTFVKEL